MLRPTQLLLAACLLANCISLASAQDQIPWITDLRQARQLAEQQQRLVLLHFWSESCPPCRLLEQNVFNQPELIRVLSTGFIPVKINVLQQSKIADFYKIERVPTDIVVDPTGRELYRTTSPQNMNGYMAMLDEVRAKMAVNAGRTLEAMAQNQLQKFTSGLPPMNNGTNNEEPLPETVNSDPTEDLEDTWQNSPAGRALTNARTAQQTFVQNEFATAANSASPRPAAPQEQPVSPESGGPRQNNPYLSQASSPGGTPQASRSPQASQPSAQNDPAADAGAWEPSASGGDRGTQGAPNFGANAGAAIPSQPQPPTGQTWQPGAQQPSVDPIGSVPPQMNTGPVPSNTPPVALDGYCPVTLVLLSKWVKGDPRFGAVHRGRTYLLGSQSDQQRFLADPDRFSPALSGYDPVQFAESAQLVAGKREHGLVFAGTYYLFADEASLSRFAKQPQGYVNVVRQAMANSRPIGPQR